MRHLIDWIVPFGARGSCQQAGLIAAVVLQVGCGRPAPADADSGAEAGTVQDASEGALTASIDAEALAASLDGSPDGDSPASSSCPEEMVMIPGDDSVCVDRWESILVNKETGERLSPYYPVDRRLAAKLEAEWGDKRKTMGSESARAMDVPKLPQWQKEHDAEPKAVSRPGQVPNGYVSGKVAKQACENAGKRLCRRDEWVRACRGASNQPFPYGAQYQAGRCNVFRSSHPAATLHDDASMGHLDPRLLQVVDSDGPLLRLTGATKACRSNWGADGLYDMVGNLDEWVDDSGGMFVGAFFSRSRKDGCEAAITAHPFNYFDYSLGIRCCQDPER